MRGKDQHRAWRGLIVVVWAFGCAGCATDWSTRRAPTLNEIGEGLLVVGAAIGSVAGFVALCAAGGGENMEYLGRPEYEWTDRRW